MARGALESGNVPDGEGVRAAVRAMDDEETTDDEEAEGGELVPDPWPSPEPQPARVTAVTEAAVTEAATPVNRRRRTTPAIRIIREPPALGATKPKVPCDRHSRAPKLFLPGENLASVGLFRSPVDSFAVHLPLLAQPPRYFERLSLCPAHCSVRCPVHANVRANARTCARPSVRRRSYACRQAAFEEPTLSSASHAGPRDDLHHFNTAPAEAVEAALFACCGNRRWARRLTAHRPYPDIGALLAAADEAGYDLSHADLTDALAAESSPGPLTSAPPAARTALRAAHAAYESSFGHAFVISLDGYAPEERLDQVLSGIRTRLTHDPDHERAVSADELRRVVRSRIAALLAGSRESREKLHTVSNNSDRPDSPSVRV